MKLQKPIIASALLISFLYGVEPSAFNAGGDAPLKTETQILNERLFNLSNKVKMLDESQEGLKSVFEGQIKRMQEFSSQLSQMADENNATISQMKEQVNTNFALQNENIEKLQASIVALGDLVQKVNAQTKVEIEALKKAILDDIESQTLTDETANKEVKKDTIKEDSVENNGSIPSANANIATIESAENNQKESKQPEKSLAEFFAEGEKFLEEKKYELADEYLQTAIKGYYKPARGNYLLGEIAFAQGRYEEAIYYYKTSATRYDKADYMPRLMLNSAKSFEKINDKENAKKFLESLIALYPDSNEAKEAGNLLTKK